MGNMKKTPPGTLAKLVTQRKQRREQGLCADCQHPSVRFYRCAACREELNRYRRKMGKRTLNRQQRKRWNARKRAGLCSGCDQKARPGKTRCAIHAADQAEYQRQYRQRKKEREEGIHGA